MFLINSAKIVLLASLYLMTSTHLKYSMFELLKNKTKCMDFAVLSVTGTKYRVTRVYPQAQSTQSLSVCAQTFRNENFWAHLQTFDMWNYEPVFRWHKAALPPAVHHRSPQWQCLFFFGPLFFPSEFVKSKTMYFPQLSQSHSLFSSLNCYCSTHDPFSLSQPPPHTPTHTTQKTHLWNTHITGDESIVRPRTQSCSHMLAHPHTQEQERVTYKHNRRQKHSLILDTFYWSLLYNEQVSRSNKSPSFILRTTQRKRNA